MATLALVLSLLSRANAQAKVGPPALASSSPPEVLVHTCSEDAARFSDAVSGWIAPLDSLGARVLVVPAPAGCANLGSSRGPGQAPPDVLVEEWRSRRNDPGDRGGQSGVDGTVVRTRVSFATAEKLTVVVSGRKFSAAVASQSLDFPSRSPASVNFEAGAELPEALFTRGLIALLAHRRRAAAVTDPGKLVALAPLEKLAFAALEQADRREVELFDPETSAVNKQLRAILILGGACSADTASGLLRAALRLIPHDSEARAAAAIGRLMESSAPSPCPQVTEQELLQSLALDRWNEARVDDLGRFYELSLNAAAAHPEDARAVPADTAERRLADVWQTRAPIAPRVIELGVSAGISKSMGATELLRTLAPAVRFDATFGRDSRGFGLRLGATLPWTRERPLGDGTVSWTRLVLSAGPRYRSRVGRFYWELDAGLLLAPAFATGHGFTMDFSSVGLDAGAEAGARVGLRFGRFSLWAGAMGSYFAAKYLPGWPDLTLTATNLEETGTLPSTEVVFLAGVSQMFWQ